MDTTADDGISLSGLRKTFPRIVLLGIPEKFIEPWSLRPFRRFEILARNHPTARLSLRAPYAKIATDEAS